MEYIYFRFRFLQHDIKNLRLEYESTVKQMVELANELRIAQNDLRIEKEDRTNLVKEITKMLGGKTSTKYQGNPVMIYYTGLEYSAIYT